MAIIYCLHNIQSGKKYIGQTRQRMSQRIYQHFKQAEKGIDTPLYRAIRKYTKDNFIIGIIEECLIEELDEKEKYWINNLDTFKCGYNCDFGGSGICGFKHSEETKKKMSLSKKGKRSGRKGKTNSLESNAKRSESLKKAYKNGTRKKRDYLDVSGENNGNYKNGKYIGQYSKYRKKNKII